MSELLRSRHAFGSEANVDYAIEQGLVDAYDVLFLNEGKIGWIDKDGNKVILEDKKQVVTVGELPVVGDEDTIYICDAKFYFWNVEDEEFKTTSGDVVDESVIDSKVEAAVATANAYTDQQIAEAFVVVEF